MFLLHSRKGSEAVFVFVMLGKEACLQGSTELVIDLGKQRLGCLVHLLQMNRKVLIFARQFELLRWRFDTQPRAVSCPQKEHRSDTDH